MAASYRVRCSLCSTNLCTLIIFIKWVFACAFFNHYSKSWERSLPPPRRAKQQTTRNTIRLYQAITIGAALIYGVLTADYEFRYTINTVITIAASIVYLFTFWYVTQGRGEFRVISRAWHSGKDRELYSRIRMPLHVQLVVIVISFAEIVAPFSIGRYEAWVLVTALQFSSFYLFLDSNVARLLPWKRNGDIELVYMIK